MVFSDTKGASGALARTWTSVMDAQIFKEQEVLSTGSQRLALVWAAGVVVLVSLLLLWGQRDVTVHHHAAPGSGKADLERLIGAEQSYRSQHGTYFSGILSTVTDSVGGFHPGPNVRIVILNEGRGWSATAAEADDETHICAVAVGVPVRAPAKTTGVVGCD